METLTVRTNHQPRDLFSACELSESELEKYCLGYIEGDDMLSYRLFRYKGNVYDVNEFVAFLPPWGNPNSPLAKDWDGIQSDTHFSGILVKYTNDYESVIVGTYFS